MGQHNQDPAAFGMGQLFWLTSEAIVASDLVDERIVLWSPGAEQIFGYTAEEALGMRLEVLVPEEVREQHLAGIRRYRGGGLAVLVGKGAVDLTAVTKDGRRRDIALSLTDVSGHAGGCHVLAVIRDVTEQRQAERELAAANETMRVFVATASHDLRTPLATIEGYASLFVQRGDDLEPSVRADGLDAIVRSARSASRIISDLLTLSQIQTGVLTPHREDVALAAAVRQAVAAATIEASIAVDEDLAVAVDADHLERMLVNFLTNAARYGEPPFTVVATPKGALVDIRVCDHGPGPPDDFVGQLFRSFSRANPRASEGTGLGLSIVKGLAEANGGTVFYERDATLGTCFGVLLPGAT